MLADRQLLERALAVLGSVLRARGLEYEIVVVGGSAMLLRDLVPRVTPDVDIIAMVRSGRYVPPRLPNELLDAVADVGTNLGIGEDWLDSGPGDMLSGGLPPGFDERTKRFDYGGLVVHVADRVDLVSLKLFAVLDKGMSSKHFQDLKALDPSLQELTVAIEWLRRRYEGEDWPEKVEAVLLALGVEDADGSLL